MASTSWRPRYHPSADRAHPYAPGYRRPTSAQITSLTEEDKRSVSILIVDDDHTLVETCATILRGSGYQVTTCERGSEAHELLRRRTFDVALLDLYMSQVSGLDLMETGLRANPRLISIVMTGDPSIESSLSTLDLGAFSYIPKPFSAILLELFVGQAAHYALAARELDRMDEDLHGSPEWQHPDILGDSPAFKQAMALAARVARTKASVFLHGESGTGKDLIARFIHERSSRAARPLMAVNCAALPETLLESEMFGHRKGAFTGAVEERPGLLEAADQGTLFLDEITEMSLSIQAKLLRVIQDGKVRRVGSDRIDAAVDVRFIAATNRDPEDAVEEGSLRADLYYRLRVVPILVPPLRERVEDIPILAEHFLRREWARHRGNDGALPRLTLDAIESLQHRQWAGNVRELQNVMEHAVVLVEPGSDIGAGDLPSFGERASKGLGSDLDSMSFVGKEYHAARQELLDSFERKYLKSIVRSSRGNMSQAARLANVDRTTLYRLMEKHDLAIRREMKEEAEEGVHGDSDF